VLRGPQGTLYGKNSTAGAVNIITNDPKFAFGANLGVEVGNYCEVNTNGMINLPLGDKVAVRAAFQTYAHESNAGSAHARGAAPRSAARSWAAPWPCRAAAAGCLATG
jgi:outer membrane receptor protein involved in Fe transport